MRVWIDVREACKDRRTGKGQWTLRCVDALLRRSDVRITLVTDRDVPDAWRGLPGYGDARVIRQAGLWWHLAVTRLLRRERARIDCYLSPTSFIVPFLVGRRVRTVPVVHDLIAFRNEPHDRKATLIERLTLPRALRTASAICAVSDATAALVRERFPRSADVRTVHAGPTVDERDTWTGSGDHLLCIATLCPRKNQLRLIRAYASLPSPLREGLKLALVGGRGWDDDAIVRAAEETPGVTWMGYRSGDECAALLRTCRAFAWVSEEEGFGLPVLDALRAGAPVLASDIPTNREVAGDAAVYADPFDVAALERGIRAVLERTDDRRRRGLERADRFSWESTADRVRAACGNVDKRR